MMFCCCKKSKSVTEIHEGNEVETGLLHAEEEHEQPTTSDARPGPPGPLGAMQVTGALDLGKRCATGLAQLPGSIYVLCKNPSSIIIHSDQSPFDRTDEVSLEGVVNAPYDLASSVNSSCLYLTDCSSNRVYKVTAPSHDVSPWLENIGFPHTLSVASPEGQVLLLRYGTPSGLEIYGPDAVQVRRIQLPEEVEYPKHAVRTSGGNYVISGKAKGSETWGVFEMNVEGDIVRRLTQHIHETESYHLAIDSVGRVIVADCWKNRLLMFDAELSRSQEIEARGSKGNLKWPWRLHYVASDNQVLVLQHDGKVERRAADGEKNAADGKTKELAGENGRSTIEEQKTSENEKKEKTEEEDEEKIKSEREKETENAESEEKKTEKKEDDEKAIANGKVTEKIEGEENREGEEVEEKKDAEDKEHEKKRDTDQKRDTDHAVVYIYSYI